MNYLEMIVFLFQCFLNIVSVQGQEMFLKVFMLLSNINFDFLKKNTIKRHGISPRIIPHKNRLTFILIFCYYEKVDLDKYVPCFH